MMKKVIDFIAGRKLLQPLFETMFRAGMYGMNYGRGGNFRDSGEMHAAEYIKSRLSKNIRPLVLFDVGANRGNYAKDLNKVFSGSQHCIYSFEPSRVIYDELLKVAANCKNIVAVNTALGEGNEEKTLYKRSALSGLASLHKRRLEHFGIDMGIEEKIRIQRLDDYCAEHSIQHIHFLKLDIEGYETKCLEGANNMINKKSIDFIQFEFGGCNIDSRTFFQDFWYMLKDQYRIYRIVSDGLVEITAYNERLEVFKNINYLAERKDLS